MWLSCPPLSGPPSPCPPVCSNFWVPTLVRATLEAHFNSDAAGSGGSEQPGMALNVRAALLSALPFCAAAVAMVANAHHARLADERRLHTALPLLGAAASLGLLPLLARAGPAPALLGLTGAAAGTWAVHAPFFSWPSALLEPKAAALGFALVKTGGALGAFAGPLLVGLLADHLNGFSVPMLLLAGVAGACAALVLGESQGWRGIGCRGARGTSSPNPVLLPLPAWLQYFGTGVGSAGRRRWRKLCRLLAESLKMKRSAREISKGAVPAGGSAGGVATDEERVLLLVQQAAPCLPMLTMLREACPGR